MTASSSSQTAAAPLNPLLKTVLVAYIPGD